MPTEAETAALGFVLPYGFDSIREGDEAVRINAHAAAELHLGMLRHLDPGSLPVTAAARLYRAAAAGDQPVPANTPTVLDCTQFAAADPGYDIDLPGNTIEVPYSGYYLLTAGIALADGTPAAVTVWVESGDGSTVHARADRTAAASSLWVRASDFAYLPAGAKVRASVLCSAAMAISADDDAAWSYLAVVFLGARADAQLAVEGARSRQKSRPLPEVGVVPGADYVKLQGSHDDAGGMVIWTQKVAGDSDDINIDGSVIVKHGKGYVGTPGYADTLQVYTLAGSAGTIIGNNDFVELGPEPYAIPPAWDPRGFIRFELGPAWPSSEVARFNNSGDLLLGFEQTAPGSGTTAATQTGTTVTAAAGIFTPAMVGQYIVWAGPGATGNMDRITGYTNATTVTVETPRSQAAPLGIRVWKFNVEVRRDGRVICNKPGQGIEARSADGTLYRLAPPNGGGAATWQPVV